MKIFNKAFAVALALLFTLSLNIPVQAATSATLGAADDYSVVAGSIVTNTGVTTMNRSLGISPSIGIPPHYTGFPPGIVGPPGTIHDADVDAAAAQAANTAAFTFIDQGCDTTYGAPQDLVGLNLVPGVYCSPAFTLSGTLTLNGTSSDVWIFKTASTFITSGTANVIGGNQCNVWWRVVSSATLGTGTSLTGNILASTAATMNTGATLNGRIMTQTAAVTLDANVINTASCVPVTPTPTPTATAVPTLAVTSGNERDYQAVILNVGILTLSTTVVVTLLVNLTKKKNKVG